MGSQLFRTKSVDRLIAETQESGHRLKKTLGPWTLAAMGVGAVIGTLFAFALVCGAVIILRRTRPDQKRSFRVPFGDLFPILGILSC